VQACRYCGLLTESLAAHRRARALDPNVPTSVTYTYWAVGDYPASLDAIRTDNDGFRGVVLAALNRPDEALASLDESERRSAGYPTQAAYVELVRASILKQRAVFQSRLEQIFRSTFRDPEGFIYVAIAAMWVKEPAAALASRVPAAQRRGGIRATAYRNRAAPSGSGRRVHRRRGAGDSLTGNCFMHLPPAVLSGGVPPSRRRAGYTRQSANGPGTGRSRSWKAA